MPFKVKGLCEILEWGENVAFSLTAESLQCFNPSGHVGAGPV
jgi:hypothetical protein